MVISLARLCGKSFARSGPAAARPAKFNHPMISDCRHWGGEDEMKHFAVLGLILVILGVLALAYQGITYTKHKEIIDIGPIHATEDKTKTIPLPPVIGAAAAVGGAILIVVGSKRA
jgi:hypothetical protein